MKIKYMAAIAALAGLSLVSCHDNGNGKSIDQMKGLTAADSLSYYLGESLAGQYRQFASSDSTLKGNQGKADFIAGFNKAMELMDNGSDAYRAGFTMGCQSFGMSRNMSERYEARLNLNLLATGFRYALRTDSLPAMGDIQTHINMIMQRLEATASAKEEAVISKALMAEAKKLGGFRGMGNLAYIKTIKPGEGERLKHGDAVLFSSKVKDMQGKDLEMLQAKDVNVVLGRTMSLDSSYGKAILTMKPGGEVEMLVAAGELFHGRGAQYGYKNTDILRITISVKKGQPVSEAPEPAGTSASGEVAR